MATTVGQHSVAAFSTPINGDPLNANVVRGNDNSVRSAYVDHDADPGIHVQSSALASRPSASVAGSGTKWINSDYPQKLYISDGVDWHEVGGDSINVLCKATETLAKGDIIKVTGFNTGQDVVEVAKVASASDVAFGICETAAASGALLYVTNTGIIEDVNTGSFSLGDILYPNTSGGLTATKPTSGNYQVVAFVLRSNASNGVLYVEFSAPRIVEASTNTASTVVRRDASGNFSAGTVSATTVSATTVSGTTLTGTLSTAAQPNVTSLGTLTSLTTSGAGNFSDGTKDNPSVTFTSDTDTGLYLFSEGKPAISTGGTLRFRFTGGSGTAGEFGAFSNTGVVSTGSFHQLVSDQTGLPTARVLNSHASSPNGLSVTFSGSAPDSNSEWFLQCVDTVAPRCYIYADGDLANHDGVYGTISDENLKQDIVDASSQWNDLKAVQFRKYRMKTDVAANPNAPYLLGVIAQEIEQTSPGLVDQHTDELGVAIKSVKSSILLMKAAKALQEAQLRIEALEARVTALEAV